MRCEQWPLLALIVFAAAGGAAAEEGGAAADPSTILVTAIRQPQDIYTVSGNASVIGQERILDTMPERPAELLNQVPGVAIEQGGGEEQIMAIRSPALNAGAGQGSILLLEDGVPLRAAGFGNVNGLYEANVEQAGSVEVVRGPGSALYGSNAVHGIVNVVPLEPSPETEASLRLVGGSFGLMEALGSLSGPVGDQSVRLSVQDHHEDGWRDDTRLDEQKFILRDQWQSGPNRITATLSGQNLDQQTGAYVVGKDAYLNRGLDKTNPIPNAYRKADSVRGAVRWQYALDDDLTLSVTPYGRYTAMNFMMFYLPSQAIQTNEHHSAGVQSALYWSSSAGSLAILGLDAELTEGFYKEYQEKPTFKLGGSLYPTGIHYDLTANSQVVAPYIHSEWQLAERTRLVAGARLEDTAYFYRDQAANGVFGLFFRPPSRDDSFLTVTPKLGLVQNWQPELESYLNLTEGARAPQVSDLYELQNKQKVGQIKAESLDSVELGTRGSLGRFRFDLSAYWMAKNHYYYRAADGTNVSDGKTQHKGLELEIATPLVCGFDIAADGSYAIHSYAFSRPDSTLISSVAAGNEMPNAPRTLANLRLGYRASESVRGELEWVHVGPYFTDNANTHAYGGHELLNFRASWRLNGTVELRGKIENLANRAYADRAAITTTGTDEYFPGAPRNYLLELAAAF